MGTEKLPHVKLVMAINIKLNRTGDYDSINSKDLQY